MPALCQLYSCRTWQKVLYSPFAKIATRNLFSKSGEWNKKFDKTTREDLEKTWSEKLKIFDDANHGKLPNKDKYYVLSMFPYPSGKLHMGHVRVYTISDVMARYHRLTGKNVIHPMGWDAFGLPAENAAIERGERPDVWTHRNIEAMKIQLEELCCSFNWNTEFATCDSGYYRWTQHLFLQMYHAGLVYQKEAAVNWDPVDQTVLADEQIDEEGRSWRSGAKAEKRFIRQWYIKTTAYSQSLYDGLSEVNTDLWKDIIDLQRHWIGKCDGVRLEFKVKVKTADSILQDKLSVFTRHAQCIYGISHILISPQHFLNKSPFYKNKALTDEHDEELKELNVVAIHPVTGQSIPLYVPPQWTHGDTLDAHLGMPDCSEDDLKFAQQMSLEYTSVLDKDTGTVINSDKLSGMTESEAFQQVVTIAKDLKCGGDITSDKARDWLISRQRYWGTPIPIIHCPKYGAVPVPYEDLPVILPKIQTLTGKGQSPLASAEEWLKVKCPNCDCDSYGLRETDTMDTFVDSSWYFLRYLDHDNQQEPVGKDKAMEYMPVDLYIGGKEHAIMHLYYARFVQHFLYDQGIVPQREPFVNLLTQGMVMGQGYQVQDTGRYLPKEQIDFSGTEPVEKGTGAPLLIQWEKMSKSKYNGVDPQDVLDEYGCDSTRLCILSNVAPKSDRNWSNAVFIGVQRWQARIWSLISVLHEHRGHHQSSDRINEDELKKYDEEIREARNYFVHEVSQHIKQTFLLSVALSRLQGFTNFLKKVPGPVLPQSVQAERALGDLVIMLAPFAPMFASELWEGIRQTPYHPYPEFSWENNVWAQSWPVADADHRIHMKIKLDGREVCKIRLPMPIEEATAISKQQALDLAQTDVKLTETLQENALIQSTLISVPNIGVELNLFTKDKKKQRRKTKKR